MGYLRKYLRQVGLVSALLIAGILGGLMAPLPSEAQTVTVPTLKFQVDSTEYPITLTPIACPLGYRLCYSLPASTITPYSGTNAAGITRQYTIRNTTNTTARLLVKDINGRDELILTGVTFAPTTTDWGAAAIGRPCTDAEVTAKTCTASTLGEYHDLRVTITHKFDSVPNPEGRELCTEATKATCNPYLFALGISGYFIPGPTPTASTAGNFIKWTGRGTFRADIGEVNLLGVTPRTVNVTPLQFQQSDKATNTTSATFSLAQTGTVNDVVATGYPQYLCSNGLTPPTCTPTVTLTMAARLYGPDSLATTNSQETIGGSCKVGQNEGDGDPLSLGILDSNLPKIIKIILVKLNYLLGLLDKDKDEVCPRTDQFQRFFAVRDVLNFFAATLVGAVPGTPCPEGACVPSDPDVSGTGTITIKKNLDTECNGLCTPETFYFYYDDPDNSVRVTTDSNGVGQKVVTVPAGSHDVTENNNNLGFQPEAASCVGTGTAVSASSVTGIQVPAGGNVDCTFINAPIINE